MKKFFMAAAAVITMTLGIQAQIPETLFMVGSATPAVEDIATDSASRTVTGVYNLQGQRVASPKGGMFIVRYSDGTAVKRVIR